MTKLYGSLEAGGTKFVCAVGDEKFEIVEKTQFPTTTPIETLDKTIEFFSRFDNLAGLAVGSFGPIDIDQNSKTYGFITTTPKPHWANVDIVGVLRRALNVPIYFTTDVNSSAFGEVVARNNAGGRIENLVYYTIGTGIGAGAIQRGEFIGGAGHPEMGHYYVAKHPMDVEKEFNGVCPFHMAVWKVWQLVQAWKLVPESVVKILSLTALSGIFKLTTLLKLRFKLL